MDLVDMIIEKKHIGQDFLTWLWWKSEEFGGVVNTDGEFIGVTFGGKMRLESADENVVCNGKTSELDEAMAGLRVGKKPEQANIILEKDSMKFGTVFSASMFEFKSVSLPRVEGQPESPDEYDGLILERVYLYERLIRISIELLNAFFSDRDENGNLVSMPELLAWVGGAEVEAA